MSVIEKVVLIFLVIIVGLIAGAGILYDPAPRGVPTNVTCTGYQGDTLWRVEDVNLTPSTAVLCDGFVSFEPAED